MSSFSLRDKLGPEILFCTFSSDDEDDDADEKEIDELSDEQVWKLMYHHPAMNLNKERGMLKVPILRKYLKEIAEHEGFEIKNFPGIIMGLTPIIPSQSAGCLRESDEVYKDLAEWAIEDYNDNNGTYYDDVQVVEVNISPSVSTIYYITFTAIEGENDTSGTGCESGVTDGVGGNVTPAGDHTEAAGSNIKTDGIGCQVGKTFEAGGSDKTEAGGSNKRKAFEDGASDKTDGVGCKVRKTFEAIVSVYDLGGIRCDPKVKLCRLKAPRTKEADQPALTDTSASGDLKS